MAQQTLDELAASLPNGFHDAELNALAIDYAKRELRLSLKIWVGDVAAEAEEEREAYRSAELLISGLIYFVCEPPDPTYPFHSDGSLTIDTGGIQGLDRPTSVALPPVSTAAYVNWIFVKEWNAFFYVAARDAQLSWLMEPSAP